MTRDEERTAIFIKRQRRAAILRAQRIVAAFADYEDEAIRSGDLDPALVRLAQEVV